MDSCCDDLPQLGCRWIPLLATSDDLVPFNIGGCMRPDNADEADWLLLFRPRVPPPPPPPPSAPLSFRSPDINKSNGIPQKYRGISLEESHYKITLCFKLQSGFLTQRHQGQCLVIQHINQTTQKQGKHWKVVIQHHTAVSVWCV